MARFVAQPHDHDESAAIACIKQHVDKLITLINTCINDMQTGSQETEQAGKAMQQIIQSVAQVT